MGGQSTGAEQGSGGIAPKFYEGQPQYYDLVQHQPRDYSSQRSELYGERPVAEMSIDQ
jgi:hypothetical protein